jgi:nitroimidazol reductase NimA-like FMN-containing flavoprotein (pyridoxamine 5'-phosphate oxidase superfamily)
MPAASLHIADLPPAEITALLERNHVGRIAFTTHDRVDIEPIHYVYADGWIYGRTSHGAKLTTLEKNRWVAFEVDEVKSLFDWRSAVVHGAVYVLEPDSTAEARATWDHALALLRKLLPATLREDDPVPHRGVVFRIAVQESTGRRAVPPKG